MLVRQVAEDEWPVVAWLYQAFRHDLSPVVLGFPYADGRYRHSQLDDYPGPGKVGYVAWEPHPNTGEQSPVAFALVDGLDEEERELAAFFVVPATRRFGTGSELAADVIARHPGRWRVAFQHENVAAGKFWRSVAEACFGTWTEERVRVPGRADAPDDHVIRSSPGPS
ncbi:GNAT family N-acetyltransferase [Nocardioides marmorisolisilvae]|uniref:GNAT family N-acetyltransferase n=1 Tax=Nocardioides marmorisolisilvae TaxID=1542737 RepID=UPI00162218B6|nr:GNAT family N-acetyltransferase [Nocardioides marmorisolisilvae]